MMESLMFPLADCGAWRRNAMVCFSQIERREVFAEKLHLSHTELKVGVKGGRRTDIYPGLSLVKRLHYCPLIGRELHSVAGASSLMP